MAKLCIFLVFLCFAVITVMSASMNEEKCNDHLSLDRSMVDECFFKCLKMGKAGGSCSDGVCQCRTMNIKDLWDKRFG